MQITRYVVGELQSNCYMVTSPKNRNCILIDCGGDYLRIKKAAMENGITILAVVLTHAHYDHVAGLIEADGEVPIYVHSDDLKMLSSPELNLSSYFGSPFKITENVHTFEDGEILRFADISLKVIHTAGHTSGSSCFILENYIFTGDTLFFESYGRCDFPTGSESELIKSVNKILSFSGEYEILCGHGEKTTLSHEKRYNPLSNYA